LRKPEYLSGLGCAFENRRLIHYDKNQGYRLRNLHTNAINSDSLFIILAFSGGGTRAAAFSYGALEELANTWISFGGSKPRLLDEVVTWISLGLTEPTFPCS
jgi:NTE family protein